MTGKCKGLMCEMSTESKGIVVKRAGGAVKPGFPIKGIVAGLVVCVGALLAFWLLFGEDEALVPGEEETPVKTVVVHESIPEKEGISHAPAAPEKVEKPVEDGKLYEDGVEVVNLTVTTNSSGAVIEKLVLANGKKKSKIHPPKPVFENPCDQVIALAISVKPGMSMPPLPQLDASLEQEFLKSLENPFRIEETDSPEVRELKARVMETKAYLVEEVKNGGSVLAILKEHQQMMEDNADAHLVAVQALQKIKAEHGEAAAAEFLERINESLKARGFAEINPGKGKERRK